MNISFIGFGNMAKALADGLSTNKSYTLLAAAPSLPIGISKNGVHTHFDNKEIVKNADVVILAVKPTQMSAVLSEILPVVPRHCLLISVAAGLSLDWFAKECKSNYALIRTMPNTGATVGLSATPMIANKYCSDQHKKWAELIFSSIGEITWAANDEDINTFTALSGSGPAYVYLFMDAMVNAAVALGLEESIARKFTLQTFNGAIKQAQSSEFSISELKTKVTSRGGTTEAALNVMEEPVRMLIHQAMAAAKARAQEH